MSNTTTHASFCFLLFGHDGFNGNPVERADVFRPDCRIADNKSGKRIKHDVRPERIDGNFADVSENQIDHEREKPELIDSPERKSEQQKGDKSRKDGEGALRERISEGFHHGNALRNAFHQSGQRHKDRRNGKDQPDCENHPAHRTAHERFHRSAHLYHCRKAESRKSDEEGQKFVVPDGTDCDFAQKATLSASGRTPFLFAHFFLALHDCERRFPQREIGAHA